MVKNNKCLDMKRAYLLLYKYAIISIKIMMSISRSDKMILKKHDLISVCYCRSENQFNSVVLNIDDENQQFIARWTKDFANAHILKDSAIVCGIEKINEVYLYGCVVEEINFKDNEVLLKIHRVTNSTNKRAYERLPVSMYADFSHNQRRFTGYIKDMSYSGIGIFVNYEFDLEEILNLRVHIDRKRILKMTTIIKRKQQKDTSEKIFEYGMEIQYGHISEMTAMKNLLAEVREERETLIRKLVNNNQDVT